MAFSKFSPGFPSISPGEKCARSKSTCSLTIAAETVPCPAFPRSHCASFTACASMDAANAAPVSVAASWSATAPASHDRSQDQSQDRSQDRGAHDRSQDQSQDRSQDRSQDPRISKTSVSVLTNSLGMHSFLIDGPG